ncbi:MAG TPA: sugar ABC transporter permease, partial [Bacilli bacterium]
VAFYLPSIFGGVAVLLLWSYMLAPGNSGDNVGLINGALSWFGISGPGWSQDEFWAKPAVILVTLWGIGSSMVIYLPALASVPTDLLEAAEIDGATKWTKFVKITLPMISPAIFFQTTMGIIGAFKLFAEPLLLPGALRAWTDSLMVYLYDNAFKFYKMGYASSVAWVLFVLIMGFTLINFYVSKKWVHYESQ